MIYLSEFLLVVISIYLTIHDFRFHRISHASIGAFLFSLLIFNRCQMFPVGGVIIGIVAISMGLFMGLGGGDVKLMIVIAFFGVELSKLTEYILWFAIISLPICLIYGLKERTLKTQIPLAPALCGALIITLI